MYIGCLCGLQWIDSAHHPGVQVGLPADLPESDGSRTRRRRRPREPATSGRGDLAPPRGACFSPANSFVSPRQRSSATVPSGASTFLDPDCSVLPYKTELPRDDVYIVLYAVSTTQARSACLQPASCWSIYVTYGTYTHIEYSRTVAVHV